MEGFPAALRAVTASELNERSEALRRSVPFLLYRDGDDRQRIFVLEGRQAVSVGRQGESDVPLAWDAAVSRVHATLERVGREWTLVDDGSSRNGSFLNGERVYGRRLLGHGDVIRVGATTIAFVAPQQADARSTIAISTAGPPALTGAQRRVLVALCRPLAGGRYETPPTNRQIAAELVVGVETVKTHMHDLFEAFGLGDLPPNEKRATLVRFAFERGAVTTEELASVPGPTARA